VRLLLKGNNYAPGDTRIATMTPERCAQDMRLAQECHFNMLRVHAHVDHPALYEAADQAGILLWQDFPLQWLYRREVLASARKEPSLTLHLPDREPVSGVHFAFVSNSSPWTYANARPVWTNPTTTFETGLGVFATTSTNVWANLGLVRQMVSKEPRIEAKHLIRDDDVAWVRVTSDTPVACQIDGDYLGTRSEMTFTAVPDALGVLAPPAKVPSDLHK